MISLQNNSKNKKLIVVFAVGLVALLALRDLGGIQYSKYLLLLYTALFLFIGDEQEIIYMLCFIFPLLNGLPGTYILLAAVLLIVLKRKVLPAKVFGLVVFYGLLEFFASIWYPASNITEIVGYMLTLFIFLFFLHGEFDVDYRKCIELYIIGVFVFCFIDIISGIRYSSGNWLTYVSTGQFRFGRMQTGEALMRIGGNANELAYYAIVATFSGLFLVRVRAENKLKKVLIVLCTIFIMIAGSLSLSRSYVLSILILLLIFVLFNLRGVRKIISAGLIIGLLAAIIYILIQKNPEIYQGFITRFSDENVLTGNGRTLIYKEHMKAWAIDIRTILFGAGVTQYVDALGLVSAQHNMILQIIECYGIFGALVFFVTIIKPVKGFIKERLPIEAWLPILSVLIFTQSIQFVNPYNLMLHYIIGVFVLRCAKEIQYFNGDEKSGRTI